MSLVSASFVSAKSDERKIYQYERSPYTSVSMTALNYKPTNRILTLSKPKIRKETTVREGFSRYISDPRYSGVSQAAAHAKCSPRIDELASPVKRHENYQYELPVPRPIPTGALKYKSSTRVNELAEPKKLAGVR